MCVQGLNHTAVFKAQLSHLTAKWAWASYFTYFPLALYLKTGDNNKT